MSFAKSANPAPRRGLHPSVFRAEPTTSPVMDRLLGLIEAVGRDVSVLQRSRHLLLNRRQVFGAIRENARGGVVLGLYLPGTLVGDRLLDGAGFRLNRVSHQVVIRSVDDIDDDLRGWLRRAYDRG